MMVSSNTAASNPITSTVVGSDYQKVNHKAFIQEEIALHTIVIFSKSMCGYCSSTKRLFRTHYPSCDIQIHELDNMQEGKALQQALSEMTGQWTVPNVFVNTKHIGGNDSVQAAHGSGKLAKKLKPPPSESSKSTATTSKRDKLSRFQSFRRYLSNDSLDEDRRRNGDRQKTSRKSVGRNNSSDSVLDMNTMVGGGGGPVVPLPLPISETRHSV